MTVIALVALLALTGCGGSKGSSKEEQVSVEEQLGFDQSSITLHETQVEGGIRDCMKAQGFDYVPNDPVAERQRLFGTNNPRDEQFGYYVTTLWGRGQPQTDPNERLRASLSVPDRKAYDRALGGDNPGATFMDALDTGHFDKLGGCRAKAVDAAFGGAWRLGEIQRKLDQLDQRIAQDQRMVRANDRWRSCMTAAGYHYSDGDAIDLDLRKRLEAIVGPVQGKFATGPPPGQTPQPYDHAALAALQHQELATWRADNACERKYITPVENVVRQEYETKFRQENLPLFNPVKSAH